MKVSKRTVVAGLAAVPTGLIVGGERLASAQLSRRRDWRISQQRGHLRRWEDVQDRKGQGQGRPICSNCKLGAKEVGPGAIIFRYRDKLYMVEGTPPGLDVQAMKNFQDNWNTSYMKSVKSFQDNWDTSYMK
jgi:hypothetical protein